MKTVVPASTGKMISPTSKNPAGINGLILLLERIGI